MDGVVFLHGLGRAAASMATMERAIAAAGFATLNLGYRSRRRSLGDLAEDIHEQVSGFALHYGGALHFVTHSMGGLLARVYAARHRPARLDKMVMLAPPNNGSEIADRLHGYAFYRYFLGPAGQELTTAYCSSLSMRLWPIDYRIGIIAGTRALNSLSSLFLPAEPHDGMVTVRSTKLEGMTDHIVVPVAHLWPMRHSAVIAQTLIFLRNGRFERDYCQFA